MTSPRDATRSIPERRDAGTGRAPDPGSFAPLAPERAARWANFANWDVTHFPQVVGLEVEEIRQDYARMRLPYRAELNQPAGVVHGGALASLIDTVIVPAIGAAYDSVPLMLTPSMNINFVGAVREQDAIAEGWIVRRGRSIVFCEAAIHGADGAPTATATLVYSIRVPSTERQPVPRDGGSTT